MCDTHGAAVLFGEAAAAADELLENIYGVEVIKALDPLKDADFKVIVERLARKLSNKTNPPEAAVVAATIRTLDVDWQSLSRAQLDRVVDASNKVLSGLVPARLTGMPILEVESPKIVKGTRLSAKKTFKLDIPNFTARDTAVARSVAGMQANFITDATGTVVGELGISMRAEAALLIEQGLSSDAIAATLGSKVSAQTLGKAANYWRTVSMAFVNRARTYEQLVSYEDASVKLYVWESVMDERTTEVCRFMDGKRFPVGNALKKFSAAEARVKDEGGQGVKDEQPWVTETRNPDTGEREMVIRTSAGQERIATIDEPGFGEDDKVGKYSNEAPDSRLEALGIATPPVHGLCRSTIVADV